MKFQRSSGIGEHEIPRSHHTGPVTILPVEEAVCSATTEKLNLEIPGNPPGNDAGE